MRTVALLVCLLSSGCYFFFPFKMPPPRKTDLVVPGEQIRLKTREVKLYVASCSEDMARRGRCGIRDGKLMRWDPQDYTTLKYGGRDLTYAEFRDLADPEFADERARFKKLNRACNLSLVPSAISVVGIAAAVLYPLVASGQLTDTEKWYFRIGGGATAVVFGGLSYPLGGYACGQANYAVKKGHEWDEDDFAGDGEELQKIVDDFNARVMNGGVTATTDEPATDTPATDTPSTEDTPTEDAPPAAGGFAPGAKPIMKVLGETGELTKFTALLVENGLGKELAKAGPYTVIALTDKSLAKVQAKLDSLDKAERLQTFRDLIFVGAYTEGESTLKSLGGKSQTFQSRKDGSFKIRGRSGSMRLVGTATNGVVYVVD